MGRISLKERLTKGVFILDGAMGTELFTRGLEAGKCNDYLNITSPDIIFDVHQAYLKAGSDAVITNTFGSNKYALARHGLAGMAGEINTAAARIARRACGEEKYVLGDIGPSGDFLQPLGCLEPEELREAFAEQAKALLAGGVDGLIIETMTALEEAAVAIEAVKSVCDLPVFISMAFDKAGEDFRTMMGVDVKSFVTKMVLSGAGAVGFNCGTVSLDEYIRLANKYVSVVRALGGGTIVYAEPNAGKPELVEGKAVYNVTPDEFASAAEKIHAISINVIGGCCGTSPAHIEAVVKRLKS